MKIGEIIKNILSWSQKYTQTNMFYFAKNMGWLSLLQVISMGCAFLMGVVYGNFLPKVVYGNFKFILSIGSVISLFSLPGINTSLQRKVAKTKCRILRYAFMKKIKWSTLGTFIGTLIGFYYLLYQDYHLGAGIIILSFLAPIYYSTKIYHPFLQGQKLFKKDSLIRIAEVLFTSFIMIITIWVTERLIYVVSSYLISWILIRGFFFYRYTKKNNFDKKKETQDFINYGKKLSVPKAVGNITTAFDDFLIWHFLGPGSIAIYIFSKKPPKLLKEVIKKIEDLSFPKFSNKKKETIKKTLPGKIIKLMSVVSIMVLIYIFISPYLYKMFLPKYANYVYYSQLYSLTRVISPISQFIEQALVTQKKTTAVLSTKIIPNIIEPLLMVVSIPLFGLTGLFISLIFLHLIRAGLSIYFFKKM